MPCPRRNPDRSRSVTGSMAADAIQQILLSLDAKELMLVRSQIKGILEEREKSRGKHLIDWDTFSSLELAGIISMVDNHALTQFPPPPPAA